LLKHNLHNTTLKAILLLRKSFLSDLQTVGMYRIQICEIRPELDVAGYLPAYPAVTGTG